ncbi:MAG: Rieske 2Fe-2S domain-containing protein [Chloroflexi bacterium]|nr:Rieske 2Fe-2S domain-containing protein [Chloroflexota bacterium]
MNQGASGDGYVLVARATDLARGQLREFEVAEQRVVVGRLADDGVVAFQALCPHENAPLVEGHLHGNAIDCARHHYLFDVHSGDNLFPMPIYPVWKRAQVPAMRLRRFPVIERNGWIALAPHPCPEPSERASKK